MRPSAALLARARAADEEALAILFDRYGEPVYRTALRITGIYADAEDIVQDVFVGLPEALVTYEGQASFVRWVQSIATRAALMVVRRRKRRGEVQGERILRAQPAPAGPVTEDSLTIECALARLTEAERLVVVLTQIEGYSHDEVAAMLGITNAASKSRLSRGLKRLRKLYAGDW